MGHKVFFNGKFIVFISVLLWLLAFMFFLPKEYWPDFSGKQVFYWPMFYQTFIKSTVVQVGAQMLFWLIWLGRRKTTEDRLRKAGFMVSGDGSIRVRVMRPTGEIGCRGITSEQYDRNEEKGYEAKLVPLEKWNIRDEKWNQKGDWDPSAEQIRALGSALLDLIYFGRLPIISLFLKGVMYEEPSVFGLFKKEDAIRLANLCLSVDDQENDPEIAANAIHSNRYSDIREIISHQWKDLIRCLVRDHHHRRIRFTEQRDLSE